VSRELIATCGLAFSGKSTIAAKVAAALDAELISYDAINVQRGFDGGKVIADAEWEKTSLMAAGSAREAIANGRGVVVDDTFSHRFLRDRFRAVARAAGVPFTLLVRRHAAAGHRGADRRQRAHAATRPHRARGICPSSRPLPVSGR